MRDFFWRFLETVIFVWRDMFQDRWRTVITLLNLIIFLCCYFCLAALAKAANEFGKQDKQGNTLLIISKNVFNPSDSVITDADIQPFREQNFSQVESVSPLIYKLLRIDDYLIQVCGARQTDFEPVFGLKLSDGNWPTQQGEVLIGEGTVLLTHWQIGQSIRIFGKPFTITGIVIVPGTRTSSVWMTMTEAERLFNTSGVYQFAWIKIAANADADRVRQALQSDISVNQHFDVFYVDAIYQQYAQALQDIKDISLILVGFSLVLVVVGTYGSVYLTLSERQREITILRAIGFSTSTIRGLLAIRSTTQIGVAYLVAWGISAPLLHHFDQVSPLTVNTLPLPVTINSTILGFGFALAVICGFIGVWMPTIRLRYSSVRESIQR
ncbi:MAG: ABC transporter permease [Anaerolineaceae bacterium]